MLRIQDDVAFVRRCVVATVFASSPPSTAKKFNKMMPMQPTTLAKTPNLTLNVLIRKSTAQLLHLKPNKQTVQKRDNQATTLLSGANSRRAQAMCKGGWPRRLYGGRAIQEHAV